MFGSEILEVAIGLAFVYFLFSLVCSAMNEWIARLFDTRAKALEKKLKGLLVNQDLLKKVYDHPLIKGITRQTWIDKILNIIPGVNRKGKPSYIDSKVFGAAVSDILLKSGKEAEVVPKKKDIMDVFSLGLEKIKMTALNEQKEASEKMEKKKPKDQESESDFLQTVIGMVKEETVEVKKKIERLKQDIETWFNTTMEHMSKWYRQKIRIIIFWIALFFSFFLNVDTIMIAKYLYYNDAVRKNVIQAADVFIENSMKKDNQIREDKDDMKKIVKKMQTFQDELNKLELPIGRKGDLKIWNMIKAVKLLPLIGWIITALAVSMGAPFWFDLLRKLIGVRKKIT